MVAGRFIDFLRVMNGQMVDLMVKGMGSGVNEDGFTAGLSGQMFVGEDYVIVKGEEDGLPLALRIENIILVQLTSVPECNCGKCKVPSGEEAPGAGEAEEGPEIDIAAAFEEYWRQQKQNPEE